LEDYDGQAILLKCWTIILLKKLTLLKPDGCRRLGKAILRWIDRLKDDLRMLSERR
jgi:hypothetical protein